jgi:predicted phage tail protein
VWNNFGVKIRRDTVRNLLKIVNCLNETKDWTWIRQIARRTGLHHKTVSRLIRHLEMFIEEQTLEPFKIRMIRLKPYANTKSIFKFLALKEKLEK